MKIATKRQLTKPTPFARLFLMQENKNTYELCYLIISPDTEAEIAGLLSSCQSDILHQGQVSEIRLAYPIKKQQSAFFGFARFSTLPANAVPIKTSLAQNQRILRSMLIKLSPKQLRNQVQATVNNERGTVNSEQGKVFQSKPSESKEPRSAVLTNQALEEKLEEILK